MDPNTLEITEQPEGFRFTSIRELVNRTLNKDFGTTPAPGGVPSGFRELDGALGGFQKGLLYTMAVKPGMGKTAFLLSLANNMAIKDSYAVAIFSSERSNIKMTSRLIESETGMSLSRLQADAFKDSEKDHLLSLLSNIAKAKIFIDDTPALAVEELEGKVAALTRARHVDLVIIDYLELLTATVQGNESRSEQLGRIVQEVRRIASEMQVPVLLFSQSAGHLNGRGPSGRAGIKTLPGFLVDHSDVVILLQRNDVYPTAVAAARSPHAVELLVSVRGGDQEELVVPLAFIGSIAKFTDYS